MNYSQIRFDTLRLGLEELASPRASQLEMWDGRNQKEMRSFEEAVCAVFDDSGLSKVMESQRHGNTVPSEVRQLASSLSSNVRELSEDLTVEEICRHPAMEDVRQDAKKLLALLRSGPINFLRIS